IDRHDLLGFELLVTEPDAHVALETITANQHGLPSIEGPMIGSDTQDRMWWSVGKLARRIHTAAVDLDWALFACRVVSLALIRLIGAGKTAGEPRASDNGRGRPDQPRETCLSHPLARLKLHG